jgi:hypothetical protein
MQQLLCQHLCVFLPYDSRIRKGIEGRLAKLKLSSTLLGITSSSSAVRLARSTAVMF